MQNFTETNTNLDMSWYRHKVEMVWAG